MPFELKIRAFALLPFAALIVFAAGSMFDHDALTIAILALGVYVIGGEILGLTAAYWLHYERLSILAWLLHEGLERSSLVRWVFGGVVLFALLGGFRLFFD